MTDQLKLKKNENNDLNKKKEEEEKENLAKTMKKIEQLT